MYRILTDLARDMFVQAQLPGVDSQWGQLHSGLRASNQQLAARLTAAMQLHIFAEDVAIEMVQQQLLVAGRRVDPDAVFGDEGEDVRENVALDVGDQRLAALPGAEPLQVVRTELVQKRGGIATCQQDLQPVRQVEQRTVVLGRLVLGYRVAEMGHGRRKALQEYGSCFAVHNCSGLQLCVEEIWRCIHGIVRRYSHACAGYPSVAG